jgi:histidyl-tRNA synthetase
VTRFQAPRGTHDVLPSEQPLWRKVVRTAEEVSALYGYGRIQTPGFEDTELIHRTSGAGSDIVQKETYTFEDRGGRSLTLRPEGTAPNARAYLEHGLHREAQPVKTYMIASMYRYGAPQRGRWREHWQWSVEAVGSADPAVDAEIVQLYVEFLRRLGVQRYEIELNSIGDRACRPAYIERLNAWLDEHEGVLDEDARQKRATSPLRVFDVKSPSVTEALREAPAIGDSLCDECAAHFAAVRSYLDAVGIEYRIVPTLVRGLDYYTRTTFEFLGAALGERSAIVGGGRYDYLVEELGGASTPGIGFGAGIERLLIQLEEEGIGADPPAIDVFFALEPDAPRERILTVLAVLRRSGLAADTDYAGRSLKGQLTQAGRLGARTIVVARAEDATIRRQGTPDAVVPLDELEARLRP